MFSPDVRTPVEFEITSGSITNAYTLHTIPLTKGGETYKRVFVYNLDLSWVSETGAIATIDWYVTYDSTGDKMALPNKQSTFIDGQTAGAGGVAETVEAAFVTDGNLYVWLKADANGATISQLRATCRV